MRAALLAAFLIGFLNFFAFLIGAMSIGGDAVNGKIVGGHYYVASHGKNTEVSQAVYTYSLWHVRSLFLTVPMTLLAMGCLGLMLRDEVMPKGRTRR